MFFEYDIYKSQSNVVKHGIDFEAAQALWDDDNLLELMASTADEVRCLVVGLMNGKHWSAIITKRGKVIRIISVRRSRKKEVALYESL